MADRNDELEDGDAAGEGADGGDADGDAAGEGADGGDGSDADGSEADEGAHGDEGADGGDEDGDEAVAAGAPADIHRDVFLVWRFPRIGMRNPQRMTNPVWVWLAREREMSAWSANNKFEGPSSMEVGPGWCASRFGQTRTTLPDGRELAIGGEHEDYYDPDFYIYNDVIVTSPSGEIEIYGYPHEVFPPTDFHSATLVGERVVIIGCLGYSWMRRPGETPVFALDTTTLAVTRVATSGDAPGWMSEHTAELVDGAIVVRKGQRLVVQGEARELVENIDDWSLELASGVWTRLTDRRWPQWELARADRKSNDLFWIDSATWHIEGKTEYDRKQLKELEEKLGWPPDFALHAERYAPPVPHARIESGDEKDWNVTRIAALGVTIRYREESSTVHVMVEGELPAETVAAIVEDARQKLEKLERVPYVARALVT